MCRMFPQVRPGICHHLDTPWQACTDAVEVSSAHRTSSCPLRQIGGCLMFVIEEWNGVDYVFWGTAPSGGDAVEIAEFLSALGKTIRVSP